jgi:vancomycin permeability regulator SanA
MAPVCTNGKIPPVIRKIMQLLLAIFLVIFILALSALVLPRMAAQFNSRGQIYNYLNAPEKPVAVVFGAGLRRDGSPTSVLRDRVSSAAELFHSGKVSKLLMSGDNRFEDYNEPGAMKAYALELGVPDGAVVMDYAGRRTYDTCYRARDIFGVTDVLLVSQKFHLPRALLTCNALGMSAAGVTADFRSYHRRSRLFWNIREFPATAVAMWQLYISKPLPVLGDPEPIFPLEAQ